MISNVDPKGVVSKGCPCCGEYDFSPLMRVSDRSQDGTDVYELLRCPSCSHTWLGNPPAPEELGEFYGPDYHQAVGSTGEAGLKRWSRQLKVIAEFKSGGSILDIGCSSGGLLACLKDGPWRLHGIEASKSTAERARALTGAEIFAGDVADADFPPNSFDLITCSDVLEHLYNPRDVLRSVSKWLKPGGIFYVFVPNIMSWEARLFRGSWYGLDLPRHLHHFSARSLAHLASSAGLSQLQLVTPPGCYVEQSTAMLVDHLARKAGLNRPPLNLSARPNIAWRVVRKGLRLTVELLYSRVASACDAAPSLQAVYQKGSSGPVPARNEPEAVQSSSRLTEQNGTLVSQLSASPRGLR